MIEWINMRSRELPRRADGLGVFTVALVALTLFGLLASEVMEGEALFFDRPVLLWIHGYANAPLDTAMRLIAWTGSVWMMVPLVALAMWLCRRQARAALYLLCANGGAALLNVAAKHGFERLRPAYWPTIVHESSYSFPSGHAMQTMAFACSLLFVLPRQGGGMPLAAGALYVVAVGASRLYLGVHFPSDVLAGWCVSLCWCAGLGMWMMPRLAPRPDAGGDIQVR